MLHGMARWISAFGLRNSENKCVLFACRMFKPYVLCAHYTYLHSACICVCELRCGNDCDWASRIWLLFLRWNNHFTNWQSARLFLHMLFCVCLSEYSFFFWFVHTHFVCSDARQNIRMYLGNKHFFVHFLLSLSLARAWEAQYSIPAVQRAPAHGEFQAKRFVIGYAFVIRSAPMANFLLLLFLCATLRFPQPLSLRLGQFYSPNIQTRETDQTRKKRRKNSIKSFYPLSLPDWCSFHYIHLRKRNSTETKNIKTSPIETRM